MGFAVDAALLQHLPHALLFERDGAFPFTRQHELPSVVLGKHARVLSEPMQEALRIQRLEVERMVRNVRGVVGISNNIIVTPKVSPGQVQAKIEEAFKREAEIDARHISVAVSDHTASLYGHVHSLNEANAARAAAASAPGIASVESHLVVIP